MTRVRFATGISAFELHAGTGNANAEFLHSRLQGGALNPQASRGSAGPGHNPVGLFQRRYDLLALRIVTSIGGTEVAHFEIWNDKAGDAPPVDSGDGLVFPDLNQNPATTTSLVMPRPCKFISVDLPLCSIIRPTSSALAGAVAAVQALTAAGLFEGQSDAFFQTLVHLAMAADKAVRQCEED